MQIYNPAPSPVLDELAATALAAQQAWRDAFESYRAKHPNVSEGSALNGFERTPEGSELAKNFVAADSAVGVAREFGESITLGRTWLMRDLSAAGVAEIYRTVAEHGRDTLRWPAGARDNLEKVLKQNPRPLTFGEVANDRRAALVKLTSDVNQSLSELGLDPSCWSVDTLDRIALAQLRVAAFDQLVRRAAELDGEWQYRTHAAERRPDHARQLASGDRQHQHASLSQPVAGLEKAIDAARHEREYLEFNMRAGGQLPTQQNIEEWDRKAAELAEQHRCAVEKLAAWESAPDNAKTAVFEGVPASESESRPVFMIGRK